MGIQEIVDKIFLPSGQMDIPKCQQHQDNPPKVYLNTPYGLQYRPEYNDWIPFRHGDIDLSHVNWGNYDLVVIDESHNFRNNDAYKDKETRYQKLMRTVIQEGVKTKVLMLSDAGYLGYANVVTTSRRLVEQKPDLVQRFLDASIEGWYSYLYGDPAARPELVAMLQPYTVTAPADGVCGTTWMGLNDDSSTCWNSSFLRLLRSSWNSRRLR